MGSPPPRLPRHDGSAMVVGGPTTLLDLGGLRIVSDPTFDTPRSYGHLTKAEGPAVTEGRLTDVDLVLVSHDNHADNFDDRGRAFTSTAPLLLTTTGGAKRLGSPAEGLAAWDTHSLRRPDGGELTVTAVPARFSDGACCTGKRRRHRC
ncbi:MBL fold metallo-hydrolase [Streptomyces sp. R28]|uniref:MBL fold metallo-hydrolase n=1 Tax=Streptomyces sp. R28 TaxID=3238628 RepID=A0AB39PRH4_9ACTN